MDIFSMLKNMDKDTLEQGLKQAQAFLSTPEGMETAKKLSEGKMPNGDNIPEELKDAAKSVSESSAARNLLGEYLKKMGKQI